MFEFNANRLKENSYKYLEAKSKGYKEDDLPPFSVANADFYLPKSFKNVCVISCMKEPLIIMHQMKIIIKQLSTGSSHAIITKSNQNGLFHPLV